MQINNKIKYKDRDFLVYKKDKYLWTPNLGRKIDMETLELIFTYPGNIVAVETYDTVKLFRRVQDVEKFIRRSKEIKGNIRCWVWDLEKEKKNISISHGFKNLMRRKLYSR